MEGRSSIAPRLLHSACNFWAHVPLTFRRATSNRRAGRWTKTSLSEWFERNERAGPPGSRGKSTFRALRGNQMRNRPVSAPPETPWTNTG
jgi:hypothetical protein